MSAKKADVGTRAVNALAGMAAAFVARKLLSFAWTKITGKEPPEHPEDPQVALGEALLATRATSRNSPALESANRASDAAESAK